MKNNFNQFTEEGLRIVDEDGVSYHNEEENALFHQEMQDYNVNHPLTLPIIRKAEEQAKIDFEVFGIFDPYGPFYLDI
jgi:hypothetical protein